MAFPRWSRLILLSCALLAAALGSIAYAQLTSEPDSADSSGSFEVGGIDVDVRAGSAEEARLGGWRLAQRKGWALLSQRLRGETGSLSDSSLDAIVTGIVVQNEQIGPNRYIARLGVLFSRARAGAILGVSAQVTRSAPMLLMPLEISGGVGTAFERQTPWQAAWTRFRTGDSAIDYVRLTGTGPDALLLNEGQATRRSRGWWHQILDQYGTSDVLIPQVRLHRLWPGGPIVADFRAGHGPDNQAITQFSLRARNGQALNALLDEGIKRIDQAYQDGLHSGLLQPDAILAYRPPVEEVVEEDEALDGNEVAPIEIPTVVAEGSLTLSVQFDTPSPAAVTAAESTLRSIGGVRSAITSSMALGGVSVMRVTFDGDIADLVAGLEARGWQVMQGPGTLRIRRAALPPPAAIAPEGTVPPQ